MSEKVIWQGTPSQLVNLSSYLFWLVPLFWLGLGIIISLWKYLKIRTWKIKITNERIIEERGVFSKITEELELFRVKDITLHQSFWYRILGLSNIHLRTSDKTSPLYILQGMVNGKELREELRRAVEKRREAKGVVERDFE
tara:strand:- start:198 stop:620 length:423 start_codon:yes stop_codon:yes gene_type:complete